MEIRYLGTVQLSPGDIAYIFDERLPDLALALMVLVADIAVLLVLKNVLLGRAMRLRDLTLPGFFVALYVAIVAVPSVIWYSLSLHPTRHTAFIAVHLVPTLFLIGVVGATSCFAEPGKIVQQFQRSRLLPAAEDMDLLPVYVVMLGCSVVIAGVYVMTADYVPLLVSVTSYGEIFGSDVRHGIYRSPEAMQYAFAIAVRFLLPVCLMYSYFVAALHKRSWWGLFAVTLLWALFCALLTLERSNSLGIFFVLAMAVYIKGGMSISKRYAVVVLGAALVGGLVHRAQYQLDINPGEILSYMFSFFASRVYLDPSYMTFAAFQEYNDVVGFLDGRSIRVLSLLGLEYQSFSSVGFLGDLWANFGWLGVVVGSVVMGFLLQFIQLACFRRRSVAVVIVHVLLLVNAVWLMYGSVLSLMVITVYVLSGLLAFALAVVGQARRGGRVVEGVS